MNILLLSPINRSYVIMPGLGPGYLASILRQKGNTVEILHCNQKKYTFKDFDKHMSTNKYDLIGIQMFTFDIVSVKKHLAIIKKHSLKTYTVLGGYHPSGDPDNVLIDQENADFAFMSEAEKGFPLLIEELKKKSDNFNHIPNLIWRNENKIIKNHISVIEDLDSLPFPAWDLMDPNEYPEAPHGAFFKSFPSAPLIITRGCPMQCTFCAGKSITTNHIRSRSVDNVIREMIFLRDKYGVYDFLIEDENFTANKKIVKEFCNTIINKNLNITWSCPSGVRIDTLNEEMLKLMEQSGCHSLSLGIEFGSQRIHDLTRKKLSIEKIKEKLELFKNTNIRTTGFFLFGVPGETKSEMLETIKFSKSIPVDRAQFNNFMPLPGSEIYQKEFSSKDSLSNAEHFFVHDVSYVPKGMSKREMKNIQRKAYLEFYLRPKIIFKLLKDIKTPVHFIKLIYRFFDALK
ncbi:MAG: B12-binding domain-containing radical SAM protein [bacterium]|nr:B12-binding domain-containing radical SAM protein [bacterium]